MRKILEKRGDSSVFQIIICITIITFLLFFPVITFSYFKLQNTCDAIGLDVIQAASTRGGVDEAVMELLVAELEEQGYDFNGNIIQQEDGTGANSVRVYTNANLISGETYELTNGKKILVKPLLGNECSDGSYTCNHTRRYRTDTDNYSKIKVVVVIPVSTQSKMINNLYTLLAVGNSSDIATMEENTGYVTQYTALSELYNMSTISR